VKWWILARRQAGVIARDQLLEVGLSEPEVDGLVCRRELNELYSGVYLHSSGAVSFKQRLWAAALWSSGVISHRSAAWVWRLPVEGSSCVHVTVGDRRFRKGPPNVVLHRVPLARFDVTHAADLPVTTRVRTVIDMLRTERLDSARTLLDRSIQQGWLDPLDIRRSLRAGIGRTGNVQLRELLAGIEPGADAESERVLHRLLRRSGLTGWVAQYRLRLRHRTVYVDVGFPEHRLAIEVDGRRYHDEASDRFEDDRVRQNELIMTGWRVLRFTWRQLNDHPDWVIQQIVQLLAA
jgi:very-short-patch-repair endonuclease